MKQCPSCQRVTAESAANCPYCDHVFQLHPLPVQPYSPSPQTASQNEANKALGQGAGIGAGLCGGMTAVSCVIAIAVIIIIIIGCAGCFGGCALVMKNVPPPPGR